MKGIANQDKVLGRLGRSHDSSSSAHAAAAETGWSFLIFDDGGEHLGTRAKVGIALEAKDWELAREAGGEVGNGGRCEGAAGAMGEY